MEGQVHHKSLEAYQRKMEIYADQEYINDFDVFFIRQLYRFFNFLTVTRFLELMRHLCKAS